VVLERRRRLRRVYDKRQKRGNDFERRAIYGVVKSHRAVQHPLWQNCLSARLFAGKMMFLHRKDL
jgi:hypothetical protein